MDIQSTTKDLGGFQVRRLLPNHQRRSVGPVVFFDHIGSSTLEKGDGIDVRPHPHIGLATFTYLFSGSLRHRDSLGSVQDILPGDVNWMIAGKGIVHSERSSPEARKKKEELHGIQTWIALPEEDQRCDPDFVHYSKQSLPSWNQNGASLRLIVGELMGLKSPVRSLSPLVYAEIELDAYGHVRLDIEHSELGVYLVEGSLNGDMKNLKPGTLFVLDGQRELNLAATRNSRVMIVGGESLGERKLWWNFVATDDKMIEKAKKEWKDGKFPKIPDETEYIPLPDQ